MAVESAPRGHAKTQSVVRVFTILELFSRDEPRLTVTEVSKLAALNRVTAYRLCRTLESLGYLQRGSDGAYALGLQAVTLGNTAAASQEVTQVATPILTRLRDSIGETVNLATRDGADIVYLARLRSSNLLEIQLSVGSRIPIHASSLGKAICAFLPDDELSDVLDSLSFEMLTSNTISNARDFLAVIENVRRDGYSLNVEELAANISGIAMPIFDERPYPVAAANIALTKPITPEQIVAEYESELRDASREISALMGHVPKEPTRLRVEQPTS
jgi:DNA-binding IclR family transcriptional regulator